MTGRRAGGLPVGAAAVVGVVVLYAVGAWLRYAPLGLTPGDLLDRGRLPTCACGDINQQVWLLAWARSSLAHGHLSLFTTAIDHPRGVDLGDTASFPLLGLLAAPLTAAAGPVATLGLLFRLGCWLTATSAFLTLRRLVRTVPAAVGGAMFGFSPFVSHQGESHLFLVWLPLLPPMLLLVVEQIRAGRSGARRRGLLLGALATAQGLISPEVLVATTLTLAGALLLLGAGELLRGRRVREAAAGLGRLGGAGLLVAAPLLAYPAWQTLAGPAHITGATQPTTGAGIDPVATLWPGDHAVVAGLWPTVHAPLMALQGDTAYLGIPLLLAVTGVTLIGPRRRRLLLRGAALSAVVAWVLALGPRLVWHGRVTDVPLPFALLTRVPVLQSLIPSRFTLQVDLAVAVLLALGLDAAISALPGRQPRWQPAAALAALVAAAALTLPSGAVGAAGIGVARLFTEPAVTRAIPTGATVLTGPYPGFPADQAMLWQAEDGLHFTLLGGYADRPRSDGSETKQSVMPAPLAVPELMLTEGSAAVPPALAGAARAGLAAFLRRWQISTVLLQLATPGGARTGAVLSAVLGPPRRFPGLDLWSVPAAGR
jgi:hypothetical protein